MKRILAILAFILLPILALADPQSFASATAVSNHTDLSLNYLSEIFGTVGNVLQGSSGQMLGHLLYKFNEGIIVVAGLWLGYSVFTIAWRASSEGSFMGQNKSVPILFLRVALGFGLLIPNPSTGYNLLQDTVMKITVAGVGLADQTWDYALDYLQNGGAVWTKPTTSGASDVTVNGDFIDAMVGSNLGSSGSAAYLPSVFANEVCMISNSNSGANTINTNSSNPGVSVPGVVQAPLDVIENDQTNTYEFPSSDSTPTGCGTVSFDVNGACSANPSGAQCTVAKEAIYGSITSLKDAAKEYYCANDGEGNSACTGIDTDTLHDDIVQDFASSTVAYANAMVVSARNAASGSKTEYTSFIKTARTQGWLTAGRYYWDLSQIGWNYSQTQDLSRYIPSASVSSDYSSQATTIQSTYASDVDKQLSNISQASTEGAGGHDNAFNQEGSASNGATGAFSDAAGVASVSAAVAAGAGMADGVAWTGGPTTAVAFIGMLIPIIIDLTHILLLFNTAHMTADPIVFLHSVGMAALNLSGDIWIVVGLVLSLALLPLGVCNAVDNMGPALQSFAAWIKGFLFALAGAMFAIGVILGFYLPLYPYMIFTFGVIGWMVSVIEAMVAAPLVCLGLTHPENHDFLGSAAQSLMLFLGVFLRPALILIGLIAGMILSYVSLSMVVYTFTGILSDLFAIHGSHTGSAGNNVMYGVANFWGNTVLSGLASGSIGGAILKFLVTGPIMLGIFTMMVFTVTTMCYQMSSQFVNYILKWVGGPQLENMAGQFAQQVQSAVGSMGGQIPQMGKQAYQESMQQAQQVSQAKQTQDITKLLGEIKDK